MRTRPLIKTLWPGLKTISEIRILFNQDILSCLKRVQNWEVTLYSKWNKATKQDSLERELLWAWQASRQTVSPTSPTWPAGQRCLPRELSLALQSHTSQPVTGHSPHTPHIQEQGCWTPPSSPVMPRNIFILVERITDVMDKNISETERYKKVGIDCDVQMHIKANVILCERYYTCTCT